MDGLAAGRRPARLCEPPGLSRRDKPAGSRNERSRCVSRVLSVLAVTSELPWPLDTGGHLRTFHLMRALSRRFRVRLIAAVGPGQAETVQTLEQHGLSICPAPVSARTVWGEGWRVAAAALRREPYVLYRR